MKISIYATPKFCFEVDKSLVESLMQLSEMHYDGTCRKAHMLGGFLYGWNNMVQFREQCPPEEKEPVFVTCDFRELDTVAKICEFLPQRFYDNIQILDFKASIWQAMHKAQELGNICIVKE